jgi:acetyltransferase EpsM
MKRYLVIGAAGHAQEVAWSLCEQAKSRGDTCRIDFFDDVVAPGPLASGLGEVVGRLDDARAIAERGEGSLVLGIGLPRMKAAVVARLACRTELWTTVIHPTAVVGPAVTIGAGSYVGPGAVLTVGVRLGRFTTINTHCLAAHGDTFGEFVTLHPAAHVSGEVTIGEGCELGAGSVVIPGLRIGAWAVLGAGCVAVRDLAGGRTWVGVPARDVRGDDDLEAVLVPSLEAR